MDVYAFLREFEDAGMHIIRMICKNICCKVFRIEYFVNEPFSFRFHFLRLRK